MQSFTSIDFDTTLKIAGLKDLPKPNSAKFLLCTLESESPDRFTAISWHRSWPARKNGQVVVQFPKVKA
jgi:hypothetical protein